MAEPDVPSDNNPAERSLRHLVISRKVSGGTRSERGTESKMTLASVFGTWRARGLNPLAAAANCPLPLKSEQLPAVMVIYRPLGLISDGGPLTARLTQPASGHPLLECLLSDLGQFLAGFRTGEL